MTNMCFHLVWYLAFRVERLGFCVEDSRLRASALPATTRTTMVIGSHDCVRTGNDVMAMMLAARTPGATLVP